MSGKTDILRLYQKLFPTGRAWNYVRNLSSEEITYPAYGLLYNAYAYLNPLFVPDGWHIPTINEVNDLENAIPVEPAPSIAGFKEDWTSGSLVNSPYFGATGFNGIPSGSRSNGGVFGSKGDAFYFATSTVTGATTTRGANITYTSTGFNDFNIENKVGVAVRLIKDDSIDSKTLTDADGNVYDTIKIGSQVWLKQNWACTSLNDGTPIPNITDNTAWANDTSGAYCAYDNNSSNATESVRNTDDVSSTIIARMKGYERFDVAMKDVLDQLLPDNDGFDLNDINSWERVLGINNSNLTESEREAIIYSRLSYPNGIPYRTTAEFIQSKLRSEGFDIYIHENRFWSGTEFVPINPKPSLYGNVIYGGAVYGASGVQYDSVVKNYIDKAIDGDLEIASADQLNNIFFVGGPDFGDIAYVPPEREDELRHSLLQYKPAHSVAVLQVKYAPLQFTTNKNGVFAPVITTSDSSIAVWSIDGHASQESNSPSFTLSGGNVIVSMNIDDPSTITAINYDSENIIGELDFRSLTKVTSIEMANNQELTSLKTPLNTEALTLLSAYNCNLQGIQDISSFSNIGGVVSFSQNTGLTELLLPVISSPLITFELNDTAVGIVDWAKITGSVIGINIYDCSFIAAESDENLVLIDNNVNVTGTVFIDGNNAAITDGTVTGFDGIAAKDQLVIEGVTVNFN